MRPQHWSVVWAFYHGNRDNCDLIEYAERTVLKQASIPPHLRRMSVLKCSESGSDLSAEALVDSLWELPRDILSMLQTHLLRRSEKYSSPQGFSPTQQEWVKNRLQVLLQLDSFACFAGAWGSAWLAEIIQEPRPVVTPWLLAGCRHLWQHARE